MTDSEAVHQVGSVGEEPQRRRGGNGSVGWVDELVTVVGASAIWIGAATRPPAGRAAMAGPIGAGLIVVCVLVMTRSGGSNRWRWLALLAVGALLLGTARGHGADEAYRPLPPGPLPSPVTVLGDPEPIGPVGWRVEVRLPGGQRVEAVGHGRVGDDLRRLTVGSTVAVEGRLRPLGQRPWLRTRHVTGRAAVSEARLLAGPGLLRSVVETVRHRIGAGADVLDDRAEALYRGLVLGDDRFQPEGQVLRFRLTGLSHLLAVSGQNVAFVLTALAPVINRLSRRGRLLVVLPALVVFALVTRLEPSVLRAVATAGLSAWAAASGRSRSGLAILAVAVGCLVLADPFLVDAIGFQLSVAASVGILVLVPTLGRRVPGPRWLAQPLATGLAAQIGVAPLLGHYFGPVSLITIPANLAAGWAAGATMVWGLSVGPVAGIAPRPVALVLQAPVMVWLWWLEAVAAIGVSLPAPRPPLAALATVAAAGIAVRRHRLAWPRAAVVGGAAALVVFSIPSAPSIAGPCGTDLVWYPAEGLAPSVLVVGGEATIDGVEQCRRSGIRSVDLVLAERGDRSAGRVIGALGEVIDLGVIRAPPQHRLVGARRVVETLSTATSAGLLEARPGDDGRRLQIVLTGR